MSAEPRELQELLPCPFCGGEPRAADLAGWEVICECGCMFAMPGHEATSERRTISAWNTRAALAQSHAQDSGGEGMRRALLQIMDAHMFNSAAMLPHQVHEIAYNAIHAAEQPAKGEEGSPAHAYIRQVVAQEMAGFYKAFGYPPSAAPAPQPPECQQARPAVEQAQLASHTADAVDGCTESNCPRCMTEPHARGDMKHAGIGSYPTKPSPAHRPEGDTVRDELIAILTGARNRGYMHDTSVPFDVLGRAIAALNTPPSAAHLARCCRGGAPTRECAVCSGLTPGAPPTPNAEPQAGVVDRIVNAVVAWGSLPGDPPAEPEQVAGLRDAVTAALAPAGWVMVPRQATVEMCEAGAKHLDEFGLGTAWQDMISASPAAADYVQKGDKR